MNMLLSSLVFLLVAVIVKGEFCTDAKASTLTYTSRSAALSTETDYVAVFSLKCKENVKHLNLYAEFDNGKTVPVAYNEANEQYQVSWAKSHKLATVGTINIKVYSEDGFATYKKTQRNGESVENVKALLNLEIHHPGTSGEGLFVQTEFMAVVAALLVWWMANSMRSQIME